MQSPDYSHFHQYRIQESLKDLKKSLSGLNISFIMRYGTVEEAFDYIRKYYTIHHIYAHEETGNDISYQRDKRIINYCKKDSI